MQRISIRVIRSFRRIRGATVWMSDDRDPSLRSG